MFPIKLRSVVLAKGDQMIGSSVRLMDRKGNFCWGHVTHEVLDTIIDEYIVDWTYCPGVGIFNIIMDKSAEEVRAKIENGLRRNQEIRYRMRNCKELIKTVKNIKQMHYDVEIYSQWRGLVARVPFDIFKADPRRFLVGGEVIQYDFFVGTLCIKMHIFHNEIEQIKKEAALCNK